MANLFRTFGATLFAVLPATLAFAHDDDPKILSRVPPAPGAGMRTGAPTVVRPGQGTTIQSNFPANQITLLSWLSLGDLGNGTSGNDCWGYVSPSGREYAIIGLSQGTGFVEITTPNDPQIVSVRGGPNSLWRDIKTYGQYAYAVSEGGSGIQVFDLGQIDSGIVSDLGFQTAGPGSSATHNVAIDTDSGYLYRCGGGSSGLRIYDLNANPVNPPYVGQWSQRYVHDVQVVTYTSGPAAGRQIAYACSGFNGGSGSTGLTIVDVTNKSNPSVIRQLYWSQAGYSHQAWLSEDRQYLYLNDELDENGTTIPTRTIVFNVSNPYSAFLIGDFTNGNAAIGHNVYTHNGLLYEANYRSGLRVFDISANATNPPEVASFDTWPDDDQPAFNGLWSVYPYFPSGTVIGSDLERGLFVWWVGPRPITLDLPSGEKTVVPPTGDTLPVTITEASAGELVDGTEELHYRINNGAWTSVPLTSLGGTSFEGTLPAGSCGDIVEYYVSAQSQNGITWTLPEAAPAFSFDATVATSINVTVDEGFEQANDWFGGLASDTATAGLWIRLNPVGTSAQPEDDHSENGTKCWVTGTAPGSTAAGQADVDGGYTRLLSPKFDITSMNDPYVRYWRWYSNSRGNNPGEDVFEVEISPDNGLSWLPLETVGPTGPDVQGGWILKQFRVLDYIPNVVPRMKIRFTASDQANSDSLVEAAVDDFQLFDLGCDTAPTAYCVAKPNSQGCATTITSSGTPSATAPSAFDIGASPILNGKNGLLFYGLASNNAPFQGGTMCVQTPVKRTPLQNSAGNPPPDDCSGAYSIDFNARIQSGVDPNLAPGTAIFAQYWYRDIQDPAGFGTGLTNALQFLIAP